MKRFAVTGLLLCGVLLRASFGSAQSLSGMWDATVVVPSLHNLPIPFRFQILQQGSTVKGSFFNGDDKVTSTTGELTNGKLVLTYPEYGTRLEATFKNGRLEGQYIRPTNVPYAFQATRFAPPPVSRTGVPQIAGLWTVPLKSAKGEAAWRLIVRQSGPEVAAVILRVDGDTGTLTGSYHDGTFVLSHFSGARPELLELTPKDGRLAVVENRTGEPLVAVRSEKARAEGLPEPADPSRFTSVVDPGAPLRFSFPDLQGKIVTNADRQFRGKVVIVSIGGSWCPNCHDEAPFLVDLYRKYHAKGLEIVLLSFEEGDQFKNPTRLRDFITHYGIEYTVLLAGQPAQLSEKLPQAVNLNSFPTTFFLGRDGTVRGVHAGFAGRATGRFHTELTKDVTARVERLLAEKSDVR
jgi:thiol-disulfide isomerase/thioredoxin